MIILIGSNKGGCGKSTLTVNLATALAKMNYSVCIIDADRQGDAYRWAQRRTDAEIQPYIHTSQLFGNIRKPLQVESERYDFVIVDVAGRNSTEFISAMYAADLIISPAQCSQFDLDVLMELKDQYEHAVVSNEKLQVLVYQTMCSTNPKVLHSEREIFKSYLSHFPEFSIAKSRQSYRKVYRDTVSEGLTVIEANNSEAKSEMNRLTTEIFEVLADVTPISKQAWCKTAHT